MTGISHSVSHGIEVSIEERNSHSGRQLGTKCQVKGADPTPVIVSETVSDGISITVRVVSVESDTDTFVSSALISMVQGWCPTGSVALTVCVAVSMADTVSEYPFWTKAFVPSRVMTTLWQRFPVGDGRDHTQCAGIDDRDCARLLIGRVNLLAVGSNAYSERFSSNRNGRDDSLRRRVDGGYGVVPVVGDVDAVTRGRDAKMTGFTPRGDTVYGVGRGRNHVHFSLGIVRDICEASIRREQDVFAQMPWEKDSGDD